MTAVARRIDLLPAADPSAIGLCRELFREYQRSLDVDLCFQNFEAELAALPGDYAPPRGRLIIAFIDGQPAACVALRPVDDRTAEMKRLYVRPASRGQKLGLCLVRSVISQARDVGYHWLVLDTLPSMSEAQAMYERLGFVDIPPYTHNPIAGSRFMGLDLTASLSEGMTP